MFDKKKYYAVWLIKEQDNYNIVEKNSIKPTDETVSYKEKSHELDIDDPIYQYGRKLFYFIDFHKGQLTLREKVKAKSEPAIMDMIISEKIVAQLTHDLLGKDIQETLMWLGLGAAIGGLLGYIIGISGWFQG